jgi:hypothetical protein
MKYVNRHTLTVSDAPTIGGCCGLFDLCGDADLMSLNLSGAEPFLDWIGWEPSNECDIRKNFITFQRPEQSEGRTCTPGYLADPCATPHSYEVGGCGFRLRDWARLRRIGPVRDLTKNNLVKCANQPRYRLDGSPMDNVREQDLLFAMEILLNDLKGYVITGAASTPGLFDGLDTLVRTGYADPDTGHLCKTMDSSVFAWNGNDFDGGAGITWNGNPVGITYDFIDVLLADFRRKRQKIQWAPVLAAQTMQMGDMALVMPWSMIPCLLDMYTCWSVCANAIISTPEDRNFRNSLNGGMFGAGRIYLDGIEIPIIAYDWGGLQKGPTTADIYFLTRKVGNIRVMNGQYLDMRNAVNAYANTGMQYTDGGRVLTGTERDYTCIQEWVEMAPRLLMWAPWLQTRFEDVVCNAPGGPLSPDPCDGSYFVESSFFPASCPPA